MPQNAALANQLAQESMQGRDRAAQASRRGNLSGLEPIPEHNRE